MGAKQWFKCACPRGPRRSAWSNVHTLNGPGSSPLSLLDHDPALLARTHVETISDVNEDTAVTAKSIMPPDLLLACNNGPQMLQLRHLAQHFVRSLYGECCIVCTMLGPTNCVHLCVGVTVSWHLSSKSESVCVCVSKHLHLSTDSRLPFTFTYNGIMRWYRLTYFIPQDMTVLCTSSLVLFYSKVPLRRFRHRQK